MERLKWPEGFTTRPPRPGEAEAVSALICACDQADLGEADWVIEDTLSDWSRLGFELERDARVVVAPDGAIAGYTEAWRRSDLVELAGFGGIHPAYRHLELEAALLELGEALAAQHGPQRVRLVGGPRRDERLLPRGYARSRYIWRMRADFDAPPRTPGWPEGFAVRTMQPEDEQIAFETIEAGFARPGRTPPTFASWRHANVERDDFDRQLAFLVERGGAVVAAAICQAHPDEGWVNQLVVNASERGRGLGRALLLHICSEFYQRGFRRVGLGVDARNPSALRLYEGVGMRVLHEFVDYERPAAQGSEA